jgi:hypothetical protein
MYNIFIIVYDLLLFYNLIKYKHVLNLYFILQHNELRTCFTYIELISSETLIKENEKTITYKKGN